MSSNDRSPPPLREIHPRRVEESLASRPPPAAAPAARILIRQRPQQHVIHHREHRRRGTNPQRKRAMAVAAKPGPRASAAAHSGHPAPALQPHPAPRLPRYILPNGRFHLTLRCCSGFLFRCATRDAIRNRHPQMRSISSSAPASSSRSLATGSSLSLLRFQNRSDPAPSCPTWTGRSPAAAALCRDPVERARWFCSVTFHSAQSTCAAPSGAAQVERTRLHLQHLAGPRAQRLGDAVPMLWPHCSVFRTSMSSVPCSSSMRLR